MAITITCVSNSADEGVPYSDTFLATGGTPPYTWFLDSGAFPPGLSLDTATGVLSGTPTTPGVYPYVIGVLDSTPAFGFQGCSITVHAAAGGPTPYRVTTLAGDLAQWTPWDGDAFEGPNIQIPPFQFGGYTYVCYQNFAGLDANLCGTSSGDFLSVSSSLDGQNFTIQDQGNAPQISEVTWQAYWIEDFDNDRVLAVYQDFTTGELTIVPFNLAAGGAGSWGSAVASGGPVLTDVVSRNFMPVIAATMPEPNTYQVVYVEEIPGSPGGASVKTVQVVSGAWGSPLTLIAGQAAAPSIYGSILGVCVDADGITWIISGQKKLNAPGYSVGEAKVLCHRIGLAGTLLDETVIGVTGSTSHTQVFLSTVPKYLASTDSVVFPATVRNPSEWTPTPPMHVSLLTSPASGPSFSYEGITDYFDNTPHSDDGAPYFFAPPDESHYYVGICNRRDVSNAGPNNDGWEQILFFDKDPLDVSWAGPTVFWDDEASQLLTPLYHDDADCPDPGDIAPPAEINSLAIDLDAGGAIRLTCGMLSDWCGVEFYMSSGVTPPDEPTVTFEKTVVGGSAVDTDFTLVLTGHGSPPLLFGATVGHYVTVPAGDYDLTETGPTGYTVVYHHTGGGSLSGNTLTVADGDDATITAVNTQGGQPEASCGMGAGGAPVGASPVGCFELLRVVATFRPARHLPVRGSNR